MAQTQLSDDRWSTFQTTLRAGVSTTNWKTWLSRLDHTVDDRTITVIAPSEFHLRWILDKHEDAISTAVNIAFGQDFSVSFESGGTIDMDEPIDERLLAAGPDLRGDLTDAGANPALPGSTNETLVGPSRLVEKYQFETFVVGPSNRFAYAAAQAVAEQPGSNYNPLFIYGAAGLGKTHLLNAIGHHACELYPGLVVKYLTSETFFSEFIDGIRRKRMDAFKQRYRTTDILLLDDVQFFEGKEQILEEFFHTFNTLYESGKQMVISSDRHPRNLATLEDRLRSRFEWGLLTDIQPPDVETRLAILKRNAEYAPQQVPSDVLHFIASVVSDNIRELEGTLTRVTAFASLTRQQIDMGMAERVLQDLIPGSHQRAIEPPTIIRETAELFGFSVAEVTGPSRRQPLVMSRQVAMFLCRELTDLSLPKIGAMFGGRDHTTVLHAIDKVKRVMTSDREVFDKVTALTQTLRRTA